MDSLRKKLEVPPRTDSCVWRRSAEKIQSFAEGLVIFNLICKNDIDRFTKYSHLPK